MCITEGISNGKVENVFDLPTQYFAIKEDVKTIVNHLIGEESKDDFEGYFDIFNEPEAKDNECNKKCERQLGNAKIVIQALFNVMVIYPNIPFGSFIAFAVTRGDQCGYQSFRGQTFESLKCEENDIENMLSKDAKSLHKFFGTLATLIEFESKNVSLFDIPSTLAKLKLENDVEGGDWSTQFLYSSFQVNEMRSLRYFTKCFGYWREVISDGIGQFPYN